MDIVGRPDIRPWEYAEVSQKLNMDHAILSVQPNISKYALGFVLGLENQARDYKTFHVN